MSDRTGMPPDGKLWSGIGVLIVTSILSAIPFTGGLLEAKAGLIFTGGVLSAWCLGRRPALSAVVVWTILEAINSAAVVTLPGLAVRYGVLAGLIWFVTELQRRLEQEFRQARLDGLTSLPNRQAFFERFQSELSRAERFHRPLTLALLDGDQFKSLNDQRGHLAGDRGLQATAEILRNSIRQYDFAARLGGDEFAVLFPETSADVAIVVAQRLQGELTQKLSTDFSPLTYSWGVVTFAPGSWSVEDCLDRTDRMLYDAKHAGHGQIQTAVAEPELLSKASDVRC